MGGIGISWSYRLVFQDDNRRQIEAVGEREKGSCEIQLYKLEIDLSQTSQFGLQIKIGAQETQTQLDLELQFELQKIIFGSCEFK